MQSKPKIWCFAGLPGAGKTTLCQGLKADGGFDHILRDEILAALTRDNVSRETLLKVTENRKPWGQFKATIANKLRNLTQAFIDVLLSPGYSELIKSTNLLAQRTVLLHHASDDQIIDYFLSDPECIELHLSLIAEVESVRQAAELALSNDKIVLLEAHSLTNQENRMAARLYLRSRNLDPGLLILRATRARLAQVTAEREANLSLRGAAGQVDLGFIDQSDSYNAFEAWSKVLVVRSPDYERAAIKRKLLNGIGAEIFGPLSFLIGQ